MEIMTKNNMDKDYNPLNIEISIIGDMTIQEIINKSSNIEYIQRAKAFFKS